MDNTIDFSDLIEDWVEVEAPIEEDQKDPETPEVEEEIIETEDSVIEVIENNDNDEDSDVSTQYFNFLKEYGVLNTPEDFEFDGTPETLQKALDLTKENLREETAKALWDTLPSDFKPLLKYALAGGQSIETYLDAYAQPDYASLDLSDEANQRKVMYDYYAMTSPHSPEKINKMINRLAESGALEEEAIETAPELVELVDQRKQELIQQAAAEKAAQEAQVQEQTKKLNTVIEALPNVDATRKNRLKTFMFTPVKYEEGYSTQLNKTINQVISNPEHFVQLADLLADYNPDKGFNLERLKTQLKSENNSTFRELINSKLDPKTKVKGTSNKPLKEDFNWDS